MWARQSGRQIIYRVDDVADARTVGVRGRLSADEALRDLLAGTAFVAHRDPTGAVAIVRGAGMASADPTLPIDQAGESVDESQEIIVTGTRLRNIESVASPLTRYTRTDIERAARADLADFLQILPQNFSGGSFGLTPDALSGGGAESFLSVAGAVSPNLRGLGPGSTLTLVNGRRIAPSAGSAFVDVGVIPQSMIERIDIVADGASAVYGADAVGGVVNIILRDDLDGAETQLSYELDDSGDYHNLEASQSLGTQWNNGGAMISGRYRKRSDLDTRDRDFAEHVPGLDMPNLLLTPELYPAAKEATLFATVRQQISTGVRGELDGWYATRKQDQVVGGGYVTAFDSRSDQYNLNGSLDIDLPAGLRANVGGGYSASREDTSQTSFLQGAGQVFFIDGKQDFDLWYASANVAGDLFRLPAGAVAFSLGAEHRDEKFLFDFTGDLSAKRKVKRDTDSAYAELLLPLVSQESHLGILRRASLSLAGRYDNFSDVGDAWTGRVGLLADFTDARLRSTYSTAFRAPTLNDIGKAGQLTILGDPFTYFSPDRPGDFARVFNILGYSELEPEKARIFTIGADITPRSVPDLILSGTYFRYNYRNRLATPPFSSEILLQPDVYGGVFYPVSSAEQLAGIIAGAEALGGQFIPFDPTLTLADYEYIIDLSFRNIAAQKVDGLDLEARYSREIGAWSWTGAVASTFIFNDKRTITQGSTPNDLVGLFGEQPDFKLRASLTGSRGGFTGTAAVNHVSGFKNTNLLDNPSTDAFTTVDLNLQYRLDHLLNGSGTTFGFAVRNLFDEDPPFVERGLDSPSYDPANANPLGRVFQVRVTHEW